MALIKLLVAPIRRVVNFPLFQLTITIAVIVLLQAADSRSVFGKIFSRAGSPCRCYREALRGDFRGEVLHQIVAHTTGFMIAYVYIAGLLIIFLAKAAIRAAVELVARSNAFGLRNAIARERGIEAYRAWLPLERIRPANTAQEKWEQRFAWPADGKPPYPPLTRRVVRAAITYLAVVLIIAALLQAFTPFPALTWLSKTARMLVQG